MRSRGVVVPLQGGLGNQLFQLAAAEHIGTLVPGRVRLGTHLLDHPGRGTTRAPFALAGLVDAGELWTGWVPPVPAIFPLARLGPVVVVERSPDDPCWQRVTRRTRLAAGYFQSSRLVDSVWQPLLERFLRPGSPARAVAAAPLMDRIVVHVRRGDYVTNEAARTVIGPTSLDYFPAVTQELADRIGVREVTVVSDDPASVATELLPRLTERGLVATMSDGGSAWADLATIAGSAGVVMSNSTFSWWGAYAAYRRHGAAVVAPTPWFAGGGAEPPLLRPEWARRPRTIQA